MEIAAVFDGCAGLRRIVSPLVAGILPVIIAILMAGCNGNALLPVPEPVVEIPGVAMRTEKVTVNQLNLRSGPRVDSKVLAVLTMDEPVKIVKVKDKWARVITAEKKEGWVLAAGHLTGFPEPVKRPNPQPGQASKPVTQDSVPTGATALSELKGGESDAAPNGPAPGSHVEPVPEPEPGETPEGADGKAALQEPVHTVPEAQAGKEIDATGSTVFIEIVPSPKLLEGEKPEATGQKQIASLSPSAERTVPAPPRPVTGSANVGAPPSNDRSDENTTTATAVSAGHFPLVVKRGNGRNPLCIKSAPADTSSTVVEVSQGTRLSNLGRIGEWYRVAYGNRTGYVHESSVEEMPE